MESPKNNNLLRTEMKAKKYKHIFFDLDNTLWDFKKNSYYAMLAAFEHFKIARFNLTFDGFFSVYTNHNRLLWEQYRNKSVTKKELTAARFKNTFEDLKISGINPEDMNTYYLQEMPEQKLLTPGAMNILWYLKEKNYLLYIITNGFKEVQHKKMLNSGISNFFEKVFISEEIKMPKPAAKVFEYAVKSSNARKTQSLMVGDDWDVDVLGALKYGMDAVYCPDNGKENSIDGQYKNQLYRISDLSELKQIL